MKKYSICKHISWQILQGTLYIIDERNQDMYCLKDSFSKLLWNAVYNRQSLKTVIHEFAESCHAEESLVRNDAVEFLDELVSVDIISVEA